MTSILLALVAHAGNGVVFILDKGLLGTKSDAGDPKKLAFYSALLSAVAIVLVAIDFQLPNTFAITWSLVAGFCFVIALWLFFSALDSDDASRVVPITGSAVPLFTVVFAYMFLQETFSGRQLLAIAGLIAGGAVLSIGIKTVRSLSTNTVLLALGAGAAFAGYFASVKYLYDSFDSFWSAFGYNRFATALVALVLLGPYMLRTSKKRTALRKKKTRKRSFAIVGIFLASKVLSTAMFLLQSYAIKIGSVSIVNALQGTQYLFVLVLAIVLSRMLPRLYKEEIGRVAIMQKVAGIGTISAGLALLL